MMCFVSALNRAESRFMLRNLIPIPDCRLAMASPLALPLADFRGVESGSSWAETFTSSGSMWLVACNDLWDTKSLARPLSKKAPRLKEPGGFS